MFEFRDQSMCLYPWVLPIKSQKIDFIWKNKQYYLRKEVLCISKDHGGLEVLSYDALNEVFKNWLIFTEV